MTRIGRVTIPVPSRVNVTIDTRTVSGTSRKPPLPQT